MPNRTNIFSLNPVDHEDQNSANPNFNQVNLSSSNPLVRDGEVNHQDRSRNFHRNLLELNARQSNYLLPANQEAEESIGIERSTAVARGCDFLGAGSGWCPSEHRCPGGQRPQLEHSRVRCDSLHRPRWFSAGRCGEAPAMFPAASGSGLRPSVDSSYAIATSEMVRMAARTGQSRNSRSAIIRNIAETASAP